MRWHRRRSSHLIQVAIIMFVFVVLTFGWIAAGWAEWKRVDNELYKLEQQVEQIKQRFNEIQEMLDNVQVILPYAAAIRKCNSIVPAMDVARQVVASAQKWAGDNWHSVAWDIVVMGAVESNWDLSARGVAGEYGPLQVMPATAKQMGVKDITDWRQTVDAAIRYYVTVCLVKAQGDRDTAVAIYNAGPSRGIYRAKHIASRHVSKVRSRAMVLANVSSW